MKIGNFPNKREYAKENKRYFQLSVGRDAVPSRYFDNGWRAVEFVVLKPYKVLEEGVAHPYSIRIAFAFWFPFYLL